MATTHQTFDAASITTLATTQLNSLAAGATSGLGVEYDNSTSLYMFGAFQLDVTFGSAPTADTDVALFIVPATDGTNYNAAGGVQNFAVASYNMANTTSQQLLSVWGILLPPTKFKVQLFNNTNQNFPASGSTVKFIGYGFKSA